MSDYYNTHQPLQGTYVPVQHLPEAVTPKKGMMQYDRENWEYVGLLEDGSEIRVDNERFNQCLAFDEELDREIYQPESWLSAANNPDDDEVYIVMKTD